MKGIFQPTPDSCVPACIAVPELPEDDTWLSALNKWLNKRGLCALSVNFADDEARGLLKGYSLGGIPSLNLPGKRHCVVCLDGRIVWDPLLGEQPGTQYPEEQEIFIVIDPKTVIYT